MVPTSDGLAPGADIATPLHRLVAENELAVEIDFHEFDRLIDSSNATPADWQAIVDDIALGAADHDGFVVLHGTDTMAYTAAALAYALTDLDAPVVLTGAMRPIGEPDSDAPANMLGALAAASADWRGVGLWFDGELLSGPRVTKVSTWSRHAFASPNAPVGSGPGRSGAGWAEPRPYRTHDVVVVSFVPGFTAERLRQLVTPAPEAVLIRAYGCGEGPSAEPGLEAVIAELVADGVPVAIGSQSVQATVDLQRYRAGRFLQRAGAFGIGELTIEAAYAKLIFLLSQDLPAAEIPELMATNLAGELSQ